MNIEEFIHELEVLHINYTKTMLDKLEKYYNLLIQTNEKINLTRITDKNDVYLKHFLDSLTITKVIDLNQETTLCDIGTGAGFPGIVLKIFFPHLKVTLVDALQKRVAFLNLVITTLELENIEATHYRIEEYGHKVREHYDIVTARALSKLNILVELAMPLIKKDKFLIAMKANIDDEIKNSTNALQKLQSEILKVEEFLLPKEHSKRTLIVIKKEAVTSKIFPRKYSEIKKKPL